MNPRACLPFRRIVPIFLSALLIGLGLSGCRSKSETTLEGGSPDSQPKSSVPAAGIPPTAAEQIPPTQGTVDDVLDRMVQAYKNASTYRDAGVVQLSGTKDGKRQQMAFPNAVVLQRPNKIRMEIDTGTLLCDGANTYGFVHDLPNQVLKIPAPEQLSIKSVYPDLLVATAMMQSPTQSFSWAPLQLILLLADDPLKTLGMDTQQMTLIAPGMIDQDPCDRVQLQTGNGPGVLWIDRATSVLRRFEVPLDALRQQAEAGQYLNPSLVVEFREAQLNSLIAPEAFQFRVPDGISTTDSLTPPLLQVLGQPCPDFQFVDMDGKTTTISSLQGKVVVMQLWTSKNLPCRPVLQAGSKAYDDMQRPDDVAMMAVCLEGGNVQNASLQTILKDWAVDLPIFRDLQQSVPKHFGLNVVPVTIILDKKGTIQSFQPGEIDNMSAMIAAAIERVRKGEDVFRSAFQQFEQNRARFEMMVDQSVADDIYCLRPMIPRAQVSQRTEPANLKMTKLWSCNQLKHPGNITVVPADSGPPKILVVDEAKSVIELKTDGSVAASHALELQGNEVVTVLRTAVAADGKRYFLGTARGVQRVHLFDENFKTLLAYPDSQHPGIGDAQLADLTGDGKPEMIIGYMDVAGVHAADLQGNRLWADRSMVDAFRVAVLTPDDAGRRDVLAMNGGVGGGTLVELDSQGKRLQEISVPDVSVGWVVADDLDGNGTSEICILGVAIPSDGQPPSDTIDAMGIDLDGQILWRHTLARGVHYEFIEPVVAGNVFASGPGQWLIAAADSTISIVAHDGKLVDRFAYGAELSGLATAQWDGKAVLLVATPQAIDAWQIQTSR